MLNPKPSSWSLKERIDLTLEVYYVLPTDVAEPFLTLGQNESHHLATVNRANVGDYFVAVNGKGTAYQCVIEKVAKEVKARIINKTDAVGEPLFQLTLAVGIPKKSRFEWVIEKGTELGVAAFAPLITERTTVKESASRTTRLHRIRLAAMKQSRRSRLPVIEKPLPFEVLCENSAQYDIKVIAHEKQEHRNLDSLFFEAGKSQGTESPKTGILCVGPEGGFTDEEIAHAKGYGFVDVGLGPRRLRTETAALLGACLILDRVGEFG